MNKTFEDVVNDSARKANGKDHRIFITGAELEAQVKPLAWAIKNIVPAGVLSYLGGASHTGKSLIAIDWCLCAGHGLNWQDHKVQPACVFYVAQEGRGGIPLRIAAWGQAHGVRDPFSGVHLNARWASLLDDDDAERLAQEMKAAAGDRPIWLIVDTQAASLPGKEEGIADIGAMLNRLQRVFCEGLGVTVIVVHHSPLSDQWRLRGSTAQKGSADAVIMLGKSETYDGLVKLRPDKLRDGVPPLPMYFTGRAVSLHKPGNALAPLLDDDGDQVVSVVLDRVTEPETYGDKGTKRTQVLLDVIAEHGPLSTSQLRDHVRAAGLKIRDQDLGVVVAHAIQQDWVIDLGSDSKHKYRLTPAGEAQRLNDFDQG